MCSVANVVRLRNWVLYQKVKSLKYHFFEPCNKVVPSLVDVQDELPSSQERTDVLSGQSRCVISSLIKVLGFLFTEGMENVEHYKMVVLRERGPWQPPATRGGRGRARGGRSGGSFAKGGTFGRMETYLCFWCLSASVCFSEINKQVHSIVLTSGECLLSYMTHARGGDKATRECSIRGLQRCFSVASVVFSTAWRTTAMCEDVRQRHMSLV